MEPWYKRKEFLMVALGIVAVFIIVQIILLIYRAYFLNKVPEKTTSVQIPEDKLTATVIWKDPAGFMFSYPENLTINSHPEDMDNYAHIDFSDPNHTGLVTVWARDVDKKPSGEPIQNLTEWIALQKLFEIQSTIESSMAGYPAVKFIVDQPAKKFGIAVVYDDILWSLETDQPDDSWHRMLVDTIADSFTFTDIEDSQESEGDTTAMDISSGDEEWIEEEILE